MGTIDPESQVRNAQVGPFISNKLRVYQHKTSSCAVRLCMFSFMEAHIMEKVLENAIWNKLHQVTRLILV